VLRTSAVVVLALAIVVLRIFFLSAGNYGAHAIMIHRGGYFGLAAAACAFDGCGRALRVLWPLGGHPLAASQALTNPQLPRS